MAGYAPPEWGSEGVNAFAMTVDVIKSGVVVESLSLPLVSGQSFVLCGRQAPPCDLELQHPSISRQHAALQFDAHGALFARDLGSTHGTFVNKKRLPANEFVRLHIGDVLAFGESTRLYALCGPQELLPPEHKPRRRQASREKEKADKVEEDSGASWGFREDAQEEEEEDSEEDDKKPDGKEKLPDYLRNLKEEDTPYKSSISKTELNDKDQRLFEQLQAKITKMENLKLEKSRILAKQHQLAGLSDGQQQAVARNEQRIESLMREIEEIEDKIHTKNAQRERTAVAGGSSGPKGKKANVNEALYGYDSDEDDFYDRTKANKQKQAARKQNVATGGATGVNAGSRQPTKPRDEALTAESIQNRIKVLEADIVKVSGELSAAVETPSKPAEGKEEEEEDSLDSFMNATANQLQASDRASIAHRKEDLEKELARQRQLLSIAMPALSSVVSQPVVDVSSHQPAPTTAPQESESIAEPSAARSPAASDDKGTKSTPPLPSIPVAVSGSARTSERDDADSKLPARQQADASPEERTTKKRRVAGPTLPPPSSSKTIKRPNDKAVGKSTVLEGGDSVWVPPKNQTGDGRTSLNDKYGY